MIKKVGTWIKKIIKWGFILWLMFDLIAGGARIVLFNNFYNVEQKMTYLYKNCNCGLPQSNYDLIEKMVEVLKNTKILFGIHIRLRLIPLDISML